MKVQRFDKAYIKDFSETSEGYLTVKAPITRPGVFPYLRSDGGVEMEAKLPEELFSEKTIRSANAKPVTDDHPTELVTVSNHNKYAKGMTHTDASIDDDKLCISFTITDSDLISKVRNGKRELSIGFMADVSQEQGEYNGMTYDSVQRNMEINHLAVVDKGRAGSEVSIRGDSQAFMIDHDDIDNQKGGTRAMTKLLIDSKEFEVDSVVKARIDTLEAQLTAEKAKSSNVDTITGERDALQTQLTAKEQELEASKAKELTGDAFDTAVNDRIELMNKAKSLVGDSFDFKGKSDRQIKEAAIKTLNDSIDLTGKSEDYVNAFYDSLTTVVESKGYTAGAVFVDAKDTKTAKEEIENLKKERLNLKNSSKKGDK
ncbi:DUF2213 domain-containing protein [Desemzia sp. C1]|uniref:DUF2213 domain-containing protein n=1 Tax=Desemzia sp. C1 TaxID=2892016 RepID=UPI001E37D16B|nr:DUF2213 domain-containing protein [Desemzia sp. C1]MCI3027696.1 DUF2213 domain-containing protein [Desemzia sp. C1]